MEGKMDWSESIAGTTLGERALYALSEIDAEDTFARKLTPDGSLAFRHYTIYSDRYLARAFFKEWNTENLREVLYAISESGKGYVEAEDFDRAVYRQSHERGYVSESQQTGIQFAVMLLKSACVRETHVMPGHHGKESRLLRCDIIRNLEDETVIGYRFKDTSFADYITSRKQDPCVAMVYKPTERPRERWCRYSGTCYMVGIPLHPCVPDKPDAANREGYFGAYMAGCPGDESLCSTARYYNRLRVKEALA